MKSVNFLLEIFYHGFSCCIMQRRTVVSCFTELTCNTVDTRHLELREDFELVRSRGKSLLKIAYVIFVILKSHDFFL